MPRRCTSDAGRPGAAGSARGSRTRAHATRGVADEAFVALGRSLADAVLVLVRALDERAFAASAARLDAAGARVAHEAARGLVIGLAWLRMVEAGGVTPAEATLRPSTGALRAALEERAGERDRSRARGAWSELLALLRRGPGDPGLPAVLLGVDDATVLTLLRALAVELPGGERLDVGSLEVEALGHLHETLLDRSVVRARGPVVSLRGRADGEVEIDVALLEERAREGRAAVVALLEERTGRSSRALAAALARAPSRADRAELVAACDGDEAQAAQIAPWLALVRHDAGRIALVAPAGSLYLGRDGARRASGSHYTPPALTEPVVGRALEPLVFAGAVEGLSRERWALRRPSEILALRVCDPSMGAGAFLVQACRYLAERVVEGWQLAVARGGDGASLAAAGALVVVADGGALVVVADGGELATADGGEPLPDAHSARLAVARRMVAERCLYGVDTSPPTVAVARLCLRLAVGQGGAPLPGLERRLRVGHALFGLASGAQLAALRLVPRSGHTASAAGATALDALARARVLREAAGDECDVEVLLAAPRRLADEVVATAFSGERSRLARDVVASASEPRAAPPVQATFASSSEARQPSGAAPLPVAAKPREQPVGLPCQPFHWAVEWPEIFLRAAPGFDAIVGNPPWVAYAGRAAQPLAAAWRAYYLLTSPAFHGYRTLQSVFVHRAATLLRPGGRLGFVLPTSMADLDGYVPARAAHDALSAVDPSLLDFGDGVFAGVFQPAMALTSTRLAAARPSPPVEPWPLERSDLTPAERALLERLAALPRLAPDTFGERGYQSLAIDRGRLRGAARDAGDVALREGTDVREFRLGSPRVFADPRELGGRFRAEESWREVDVLVRQTARYPIAAVSDGLAFRNSVLAGFARGAMSAHALAAHLNATSVRWLHYHRFRDARQGMPQLKIGHLRATPAPAPACLDALDALGRRLHASVEPPSGDDRAELDRLVARALGLSPEEHELVCAWWRRQ